MPTKVLSTDIAEQNCPNLDWGKTLIRKGMKHPPSNADWNTEIRPPPRHNQKKKSAGRVTKSQTSPME
jgi:hypothetical protein